MDASAHLAAARLMTREARYEEALRELQWFHEHALEDTPGMYGVRLSYALIEWADLGQLYPPARTALEELRERKTALLLAGQGNRHLFTDVRAIHDAMGEQERTHALFVELDKIAPDLAQSCANQALTAIIAAGDYALAERLLPEPERVVRRHARLLNEGFADRRRMRFTRAPLVATHINICVDNVREVLTVLENRGRMREAARLRTLAADLIPATTIRRAVRAALLPGAMSWRERASARLRRLPRRARTRR